MATNPNRGQYKNPNYQLQPYERLFHDTVSNRYYIVHPSCYDSTKLARTRISEEQYNNILNRKGEN